MKPKCSTFSFVNFITPVFQFDMPLCVYLFAQLHAITQLYVTQRNTELGVKIFVINIISIYVLHCNYKTVYKGPTVRNTVTSLLTETLVACCTGTLLCKANNICIHGLGGRLLQIFEPMQICI